MQIGQFANQGLRQQQQISASQLQSLTILRVPMQELSSYLYEQIYENPFFDVDAASETDKPEPRTPTVQERRTEGADGHDLVSICGV